MNKVTNIDGSPFIQKENPVHQLNEAIERLLSPDDANIDNWVTLHIAEQRIQFFLSQTRIKANLVSGNYEAGLKMVAPIFCDVKHSIRNIPYQNMLIALLARLKQQNKIQWEMLRTNLQEMELDDMVDAFISGGGSSPNDAIHIRSSTKTLSAAQKIA